MKRFLSLALVVAVALASAVSLAASSIDDSGDGYELVASAFDSYVDGPELMLSVDKTTVRANDYFILTPYFDETVNGNVSILDIVFDTADIEYRGFTPADGAIALDVEATDTGVKMTIMFLDYNMEAYGEIMFSVNEDPAFDDGKSEIIVNADVVITDENGEKALVQSSASAFVKIGASIPTEMTLIELSILIDAYGMTDADPDWSKYSIYDVNENGEIDIFDITYFARLVK